MILDTISQVIALLACFAVIAVTEPALNRATVNGTRLCIRLSLLLICAGAVLTAAAILPDALSTPWPGVAALASGIALMLFTTRRRNFRRHVHGTL